MNILPIFMTALFVSLGLVPVLRRWALTSGALDIPDKRKVHKQAIPRLGGIAIYISYLFATLVFVDPSREVRGVLAGGLVIFVIGLIDDLYGLSSKMKFIGEIAGVLVTMTIGHLYLVNLGNLFGFGNIVLPLWLAIPFTIFAVVGVINAINLIDGLDGLSGSLSVIALAAFMLLAFLDGNSDVMFLCAALMGAVLGFLKYNLYPARIFMGDTGSLGIGFVLGFLAVLLTQPSGTNVSPLIPVVILGLPIIDAIWVMTRRVMKGEKPFSPDMTHVHHKFLNLGFEHRFTVILITGISLFWSLLAITAFDWPEYLLLLIYLVVSLTFYGLLRYLINHREQYRFMAKDSRDGIRQTATYNRLSSLIDSTSPLLLILLIVYLLLAVIASFSVVVKSLWIILACAAGFVVYWLIRHSHHHSISHSFLKSSFYLSGLIVALLVDSAGCHNPLIVQSEILIFALITTLVIFKALFRLEGEFFVGTPELVVLITGVFALVAFSQIPELKHLSSVPIRGGILFLAMNTILFNWQRIFHKTGTDFPGETSKL